MVGIIEATGTSERQARRRTEKCIDGNEAAARIAYALSEVIAIYPITPASGMGELSDAWAAAGRANHWGTVPEVVEMQSEAGAAGALHGAILRGALGTTFTASQGLLLMLPNMYKIAGELAPAVIHVAARSIATHALSIFGDHSDVMAARMTGFAILSSSSVQEAHDLALVAHAAALESRLPFLHFFDGFRTSHEVNRVELLDDGDIAAMIDDEWVLAHRRRALSPERPMIRGTAQNPDVFFQSREAANPVYDSVPEIVQAAMDRLAARTGRPYHLVDYHGHPDAERVIVMMGSGSGAATEAVDALVAAGEKIGVLTVRLFRPFPTAALLAALPASARSIAVLDRSKEPGSVGEPLLEDVVTTLADRAMDGAPMPRVIGGRYGLASKELTPAMVKAVFDELASATPRRRITVGIIDDVGGTSVRWDPSFVTENEGRRVVLYGLGSDGTVSAAKEAVKIIGEHTPLHAQGYFVYDSKKSGTVTMSHVRVSPDPIRSTYLIDQADLVGCHQWSFLERVDVLASAAPGATVLLNSPYPADEVWDRMPREVQEQLIDKGLRLFVVDAHRIAADVGLGGRINSVMLPCLFHLAGFVPADEAEAAIREAIRRSYGKRGDAVIAANMAAIDAALAGLHEVAIPSAATSTRRMRPVVPEHAPEFVERVTARMLAGQGDLLPVSALPVDGTFPSGTARFEKRGIALDLPSWDPSICIDCGKCTIVCPHAAIRMKVYAPDGDGAPDSFQEKDFRSREVAGHKLNISVAPDDCTGCGVCVDVCPAKSKTDPLHKALNMVPATPEVIAVERERWEWFTQMPETDRSLLAHDSVKGSQVLEPLFEFSGACAGCGETPYLKLITQLFGDRLLVANATGCSSIYGGNLPTTPWSTNAEGRGPAWANSLFEDNAEFGLGMRLAVDRQNQVARRLLSSMAADVGVELAASILEAEQADEASIAAQRLRVTELRQRLAAMPGPDAAHLASVSDALVRTSVWIVGGDGWAYDIGSGGLDHVLASGRNVNILVLDTEVYSNTGGQASKATPRGAVAKFATAGKRTGKKDLGMVAMSYGDVYVAEVALGGSDVQTVKAMLEAEAWEGPSLIIAYSTCTAHGIDMASSMSHQKDMVKAGYWPLYRYHPGAGEHEHPLQLDSHAPVGRLRDVLLAEGRFAMLARSDPTTAARMLEQAEADVAERWRLYEQLSDVERTSNPEQGTAS